MKQFNVRKQRNKRRGLRKWDEGEIAKDAVCSVNIDLFTISGYDLEKFEMHMTGLKSLQNSPKGSSDPEFQSSILCGVIKISL